MTPMEILPWMLPGLLLVATVTMIFPRTVILLVVIALAMMALGCAGQTYVEIGAGYNTSLVNDGPHKWEDAGSPAFYGSVRKEWDITDDRLKGFCQYTHVSQWFAGPPLNDKAESSLDHVGCGTRFRIGR